MPDGASGYNGRGRVIVTIGWIRHGTTDWNLQQRAQGQTDIPLNSIGRRQAHILAERLKGETWHYIYSSDLSRAKETADIIGKVLGLSVTTDARLREMSFGIMEGTTPEERIERWGPDWEQAADGREDPAAVAERGASFVRDIAGRHPGKRVLAISHGALIANTLKKLLQVSKLEGRLENTSLTRIKPADNGWICEVYNCVKHFDEETEETR